MSNRDNMCQPPDYPYELIREEIGDFIEQAKRRREIEEIVGDMPIDRLRELVEADREGRCVVLPCKIGDVVYWVVDRGIYECYFDLSELNQIGKNVFLTFEAAEAALKGEQHEISES